MAATVFSAQLQSLRKENGTTQEQLAQHLGVSPQAVSKWENGSYPDGDLLPKIADFFGVSIDYLYGRGKEEVSLEQRIVDEIHALEINNPDFQKDCIDKMLNIIWAMQLATWHDNRYWYDIPDIDENSCVTASSLTSNEGFTFMRLNKDLRFYFLAKTPENGYEPLISKMDELAELFSFLGDKTNLKVLLFMMSLANDEFVKASTVAEALQIPAEKAQQSLDKLNKFGSKYSRSFPQSKILGEQLKCEKCYGKEGFRTALFLALLIVAESAVNQPDGYNLQVANGSDWIKREKLNFIKKND